MEPILASMIPRCIAALLLSTLFATAVSSTQAADLAALQSLLNRPILASNQPMAEVQAFTERRVPVMPSVRTAGEWEKIAKRMRRDVLEKVVFRGEAARWRDAKAKVEWLETIEG